MPGRLTAGAARANRGPARNTAVPPCRVAGPAVLLAVRRRSSCPVDHLDVGRRPALRPVPWLLPGMPGRVGVTGSIRSLGRREQRTGARVGIGQHALDLRLRLAQARAQLLSRRSCGPSSSRSRTPAPAPSRLRAGTRLLIASSCVTCSWRQRHRVLAHQDLLHRIAAQPLTACRGSGPPVYGGSLAPGIKPMLRAIGARGRPAELVFAGRAAAGTADS